MINFNSICDAVCYWLGYQLKIGRERLIHEASLRYPIADAITSGETAIDKIQLEKGHPYFQDKVVDIFVCTENVKTITIDKISSIFELKLSKSTTGNKFSTEHQRVVDDILRLAYFNLASKKDAYFLICGPYKDFKNYFVGDMDEQPVDTSKDFKINEQQGKSGDKSEAMENSQKIWRTESSLYKDYFHFDYTDPKYSKEPVKPKEHTFEIQNKDADTEEFGLKSFKKRYTSKKDKTDKEFIIISDTLKIKTTCVAITPFESITNRTHACGIWKIEAINEN
jgi:hypothetical protein